MDFVPRFQPIRWRPRPVPIQEPGTPPYMFLRIPSEWLPHIMGLLEALADPMEWIGDDEERRRGTSAVQYIMGELFSEEEIQAMLSLELVQTGEGEDGRTYTLYYRFDGGSPVSAGSILVPAGADGAQGEPGPYIIPDLIEEAGETKLRYRYNTWDQGQYVILPENLKGPAGADGTPGEPGQPGLDGGFFAPELVSGFPARPDGQFPVNISWKGNGGLESFIDLTDILGPQGPAGADGTPGEPGEDGGALAPITHAYPNGTIKLRWFDADGQPPYDPDNPATYFETPHNVRGPQGLPGEPGAAGEGVAFPEPWEWQRMCYVATRMIQGTATWITNEYFNYVWSVDALREVLDEVPILSIAGGIVDIAAQMAENTIIAVSDDGVRDNARELLYCFLVSHEGMTDTEIQGWRTQFGDLASAFAEHGAAGMLVWLILHDAGDSPAYFRDAVLRLSRRALFFDGRECEEYPCTPTNVRWGITFDFTLQAWGWVAAHAYSGTWTPAGWQAGCGELPLWISSNGQDGNQVYIYRQFERSARYDQIGIVFNYNPGNGNVKNARIMVGPGEGIIHLWDIATYAAGRHTLEWNDADVVTLSELRVFINSSAQNNCDGQIYIEQIYISGPGDAPILFGPPEPPGPPEGPPE